MSRLTDLQTLLTQYQHEFQKACDASLKDAKLALKPGQKVPEGGQIYGEEAKAEFKSLAESYKIRADRILDAELAQYDNALTEAPTDEAVRVISLLRDREFIDATEFEAVVNKYGNNILAYRALNEIGKKHGYHLPELDRLEKYEGLKMLKKSIDDYLGHEVPNVPKISFIMANGAPLFS